MDRTLTVMLVEDNEDDEYLSARALHKAGYELSVVARDGQEALNCILDTSKPLPGLLLLDLRLPKIDGLNVLASLRSDERTRELPVVIISSTEDPLEHQKAHRLGVLAFLNKPLDTVELEKALTVRQRSGPC